MSSPFSIDINLSEDTLRSLKDTGYSLYAFKAVKSDSAGTPLVWFASDVYGLRTTVDWEEQYQAYTTAEQPVPNGVVRASNPVSIDLGQRYEVHSHGSGPVVVGTTPGAVEIDNLGTLPWTCGLAQSNPAGQIAPMCAFPLFGQGMTVIAPVEKVLLTFATTQIDTGTVVERALSTSLLIDLTGVQQRTVAFDINTGWSWTGVWAQQFPVNVELAPLLFAN